MQDKYFYIVLPAPSVDYQMFSH